MQTPRPEAEKPEAISPKTNKFLHPQPQTTTRTPRLQSYLIARGASLVQNNRTLPKTSQLERRDFKKPETLNLKYIHVILYDTTSTYITPLEILVSRAPRIIQSPAGICRAPRPQHLGPSLLGSICGAKGTHRLQSFLVQVGGCQVS